MNEFERAKQDVDREEAELEKSRSMQRSWMMSIAWPAILEVASNIDTRTHYYVIHAMGQEYIGNQPKNLKIPAGISDPTVQMYLCPGRNLHNFKAENSGLRLSAYQGQFSIFGYLPGVSNYLELKRMPDPSSDKDFISAVARLYVRLP